MDVLRGIGWILVTIFLANLVLWHIWPFESFSSNREKAESIVSWFHKEGKGAQYANFKADVPGADVLDYLDARALGGGLSVDNMEKKLNQGFP